MHDNQVLAYGLLGIARLGLPLVTSIHHPISVDRRIELAEARGLSRLSKRRWYGFVRMQGRVARRVGPVLTGSQSSRDDICRDFRVPRENVHVIPLGVDTRLFHPRPAPRVPGRIVAVASADSPVKGISTLLRAVAKLTTERNAVLTVVGRPAPGGPTERLVAELALGDRVRFVSGISDDDLAELLASAEIAVVPSLYEGFSLPAVEHMASGTPLIASRTGALPEVTGDAALLVTPGDAEELAVALRTLHDSAAERERLSALALRRVQERFAWPAVARATVEQYRRAIGAAQSAEGRDSRDGRPEAGPSGCHAAGSGGVAPEASRGFAVLTVDFARLLVGPGDRVLDLGCGAGRHAFEALRRGRARGGPGHRPGRAAAGGRHVRGDAGGGRGAARRVRRARRQGTPPRCRSPTGPSTGSSPPRCSSTFPPTRRP